jgi:quercetin 2,3-dioxygenase
MADAPVPDSDLEIRASHHARVGAFDVRRALPQRTRRTVGAWCFADHMGPADVSEESGLDIGPHPHTGLHTVTWLIDGEVLHRDSLGSEQVVAPGQLNLMSAGAGVAHAEEATGHYRGRLEGIQLWVAQPEATRHGPPAFTHAADLPRLDVGEATATIFLGTLGSVSSPVGIDSDLVGADLAMNGRGHLELRRDFEYAIVVLRGRVTVRGRDVAPGNLALVPRDIDELELVSHEPTRAILIGGVPFDEPLFMWWNFVARSRDEVERFRQSWANGDDRFPGVASALARIEAPAPYWRHEAIT